MSKPLTEEEWAELEEKWTEGKGKKQGAHVCKIKKIVLPEGNVHSCCGGYVLQCEECEHPGMNYLHAGGHQEEVKCPSCGHTAIIGEGTNLRSVV